MESIENTDDCTVQVKCYNEQTKYMLSDFDLVI